MKKVIGCFILFTFIFGSCSGPALETVPEVLPDRFTGTWFEIASLPTTYNKGCSCSKLDMEMGEDGKHIKMISSCMKKGKQGAVLAKVFFKKESGNAKMSVQMFWPFRSDYYIIALGEDYTYAMAGNPERSVLQILSREKTMDDALYDELISKAASLGYDTTALTRTGQVCD